MISRQCLSHSSLSMTSGFRFKLQYNDDIRSMMNVVDYMPFRHRTKFSAGGPRTHPLNDSLLILLATNTPVWAALPNTRSIRKWCNYMRVPAAPPRHLFDISDQSKHPIQPLPRHSNSARPIVLQLWCCPIQIDFPCLSCLKRLRIYQLLARILRTTSFIPPLETVTSPSIGLLLPIFFLICAQLSSSPTFILMP